ncbi:3-dehydroquinate synthase [Thiospirochaeta perfilievii]|uniref:3-dehydroquinate synthase n=1 Tax=Thiospirochaeta perfilievii TaxID=252967 RepID=A0A5C1QGF5_9SPIO|nr:3-dehydroquinate synthase family protein [Thiospirochaeta perfilievii]QEN05694.1 3-dehydroquinate synthase [Thiospirochaeta perfilievii]
MSSYEFNFGQFKTAVGFYELENLIPDSGSLFIADENTSYLIPKKYLDRCVILPPGEEFKSWESIDKILTKAVDLELARDANFVGVGGGVICDMTAFAASLFMRGCSVTLIPTTLLSMADAALGGKTGVDFKGYKNLVGSFYPAKELRIAVDSLKTLSKREFLSGLAEVIKSAMIGDVELLEYIENSRDDILDLKKESLNYIINSCIKVKGRIVEEDLYEKSVRANLNLGHTFGHALESVTGFSTFSHGEGVVWGITKAMDTSLELGIVSKDYHSRILSLLKSYNYRLEADVKATDIIDAMKLDKKKKGGVVKFILQTAPGETLIREVPEDVLYSVLK